MRKNIIITSLILLSFAILTSCSKNSTSTDGPKTTIGETKPFGADSIHTWMITDASGTPTSIGVTFKASALAGLPATDTMFMVMLPMMGSMSGMMAMNFDHVEVDWSAHGDASPSVYNIPHLDCHFMLMSMANQMMIMGGMDSGMMGTQYVPMNCMADSVSMAGMGVHYMDTTGQEFHGSTFNHSCAYGFYHTDMTFIEAMCSKAFLDTKTNYTGAVKQPTAFKKSGYYPMNYAITYDATTLSYTYSLTNLMTH